MISLYSEVVHRKCYIITCSKSINAQSAKYYKECAHHKLYKTSCKIACHATHFKAAMNIRTGKQQIFALSSDSHANKNNDYIKTLEFD